MNRRYLLAGFSSTLLGSFLFKFSFIKHKIKTTSLNKSQKRSGPYKVTKHFISNLHPDTQFNSAKEFWANHPDPIYKELNQRFKTRGLLISSTSTMMNDKKTIVVEKVYKNEQAFNFYKEVSLKYHDSTNTRFANDLKLV